MSDSAARPFRRAAPPLRMQLRQLHLYLGVFFAPCILFFALTGAVQVLGLHEASRDGGYRPPPVVEKLSEVHIHQRYQARRKPPAPAAGQAARPKPQPAPPAASSRPELAKWFFLATAGGLVASSLLGIWMAVAQSRQRRLAWVLLAAGCALPALLVLV